MSPQEFWLLSDFYTPEPLIGNPDTFYMKKSTFDGLLEVLKNE